MDWRKRRLLALGALVVLLAAGAVTQRQPQAPLLPEIGAAATSTPAKRATALELTSPTATGNAPRVATMTPEAGQQSANSSLAPDTPGPTGARTPLPPTLTGGENDQSTWQEYRLLSWNLAFRYPRQWQVEFLAPQAPGEPEAVEIRGGGRSLRLLRQAPGRSLDGAQRLEPVAVGPVRGDKYVWRGPQGELYEALIIPQARRDAIGMIQYQLLGGDEDPIYMALFDAVLTTVRLDYGVTPAGPTHPAFAPYQPRQVNLPARHAGYALPLDLSQIANLSQYNLTRDEKEALTINGFYVAPAVDQDFSGLYQELRGRYPLFISTDSVLHAYHQLFDKVLRSAENQHLAPDLLSLSRQLLATAQSNYQAARGTPAEDAAARVLAYFAVAVRLQDPQAAVPSAVQQIVEQELALIAAHQGVAASPLLDRPGLPESRRYREDYSQYVPRGHYTQSEALRRYFQAMTWYGRINLRLREREEVRMALLIAQTLSRTWVGSRTAISVWESIYEPTAFFVGRTDDLSIYDLRNLANSLYGGLGDDPRLFADDAQLDAFIRAAQALPPPKINSLWVQQGDNPEAATRGFRFMGQRFVIDSYIFGQLIWNKVGTPDKPRLLPRGLDIATALGSEEAGSILEDLGDTACARYPEQLTLVRQQVDALPEETWGESLYWAWLNALRPLLEAKDARYPGFMRSKAWARKDLQTMLGSWTELKHDTLLYAKQPVAVGMGLPPSEADAGYVEPDPEVYARLAALTEMAIAGLDSRGLLGAEERAALQRLQAVAERLQSLAEKELAGQTLSDDDKTFILGYGSELIALARAAADVPSDGQGVNLDSPQAALVADVATGGANVLEEAIGRVSRLYVVVQSGQHLILAQGGVYSYYEFPWPSSERLTDAKWQEMLEAGQVPPQPGWVQMFTLP